MMSPLDWIAISIFALGVIAMAVQHWRGWIPGIRDVPVGWP